MHLEHFFGLSHRNLVNAHTAYSGFTHMLLTEQTQ